MNDTQKPSGNTPLIVATGAAAVTLGLGVYFYTQTNAIKEENGKINENVKALAKIVNEVESGGRNNAGNIQNIISHLNAIKKKQEENGNLLEEVQEYQDIIMEALEKSGIKIVIPMKSRKKRGRSRSKSKGKTKSDDSSESDDEINKLVNIVNKK